MTDPPAGDSRRVSVRHSLAGVPKYCPNCLSKLEVTSPISGWLVPNDYYCPNCGYSGSISLERDPALSEDAEDKNK